MIECPDFLPLGSVVRLQGASDKKLLVIGRAITIHNPDAEGKVEYFDYALCLYPEGVVSDSFIYSNHDNVREVVFRGLVDEEDEELIANVRSVLGKVDGIQKGKPAAGDMW